MSFFSFLRGDGQPVISTGMAFPSMTMKISPQGRSTSFQVLLSVFFSYIGDITSCEHFCIHSRRELVTLFKPACSTALLFIPCQWSLRHTSGSDLAASATRWFLNNLALWFLCLTVKCDAFISSNNNTTIKSVNYISSSTFHLVNCRNDWNAEKDQLEPGDEDDARAVPRRVRLLPPVLDSAWRVSAVFHTGITSKP